MFNNEEIRKLAIMKNRNVGISTMYPEIYEPRTIISDPGDEVENIHQSPKMITVFKGASVGKSMGDPIYPKYVWDKYKDDFHNTDLRKMQDDLYGVSQKIWEGINKAEDDLIKIVLKKHLKRDATVDDARMCTKIVSPHYMPGDYVLQHMDKVLGKIEFKPTGVVFIGI